MPQVQTAERLLQSRHKIIDLWEKRAYREVAAAQKIKSLALRNELENFLLRLAEALKTNGEKSKSRLAQEWRERVEISTKHGEARAGELGYFLHEVIFEFHILRQVTFEVLEEEGPLSPVERDIIIDTIEQAVNNAASGFSDTLREIQEHFAVTLTHDLRGPLTTSKAAAQIILRWPDRSDMVEKSAFQIIASMERLNQMIGDVLNASRLRAGEQIELDYSEFNLDSLVREVVDEFRMTEPERFIVTSPNDIVGCWSLDGIRRVLQNLITNAIKYGDPGSLITVSLEKVDPIVRLTVHNTGNPIPKEKQSALFKSFQRIPTAAKRPGWGIGLFLAKGIVEAQGGKIYLKNSSETGTDFVVDLPRDSKCPDPG